MPAERPLFAYGTLLTGALDPGVDRRLARDARRLGPARMRGRLHDQGGYPGLLDGDGWVAGALLCLDAASATLALLDRYEGFDPARPAAGEFVRVTRPVFAQPSETAVEAWVYLLNPARVRPGRRIAGGDWRRYRQRRPAAR